MNVRFQDKYVLNSDKTHCPQGHAYDDNNTYVDFTGSRRCRICRRHAVRRFRSKSKGIKMNDKNSFKWSNQKIKKLLLLKAQGMSLRDIGKRFGITRNAVVGKLDRIKNPSRHRVYIPKKGIDRPAVRHVPKPDKTYNKVPPLKPPPASSQYLQFGSYRECRYPYGSTPENNLYFCREPTQLGSSYCAEHHKVCHKPVTKNIVK